MSTSDIKKYFIDALNDTPLAPYLDRAVDGIQVPTCPEDALSAQIACGIYAYNMSLYLKAWEGIPLLYVALYTGNHVQALQGLLLSSLEKVRDPRAFDFEIFSPNPNQELPAGSNIDFSIQLSAPMPTESVSCRLLKDGEYFKSISLDYVQELTYSTQVASFDPAAYTAEITVTWVENLYMKMQSVSFIVIET